MYRLQFLFVTLIFGVSVGDPKEQSESNLTQKCTPQIETTKKRKVQESAGTLKACKKTDKACIQESASFALKRLFAGFPDHGVETSDPLVLDEIVGDLSTLKFKFTDTVAVGLKNCHINNADLDLENSKMKFNLVCSNIEMKGHYVISGQLLILPVEGDGDYEIKSRKWVFGIDADLKQVQGSDGQQHLTVKNFKFTAEAQEPISYDFKNLFNGQKDLAEGVLKFANENWKEVADFVQEPVVSVLLKGVVKNLNKYLKLVTVNELFLDD